MEVLKTKVRVGCLSQTGHLIYEDLVKLFYLFTMMGKEACNASARILGSDVQSPVLWSGRAAR